MLGDNMFIEMAIDEAKKGLAEDGIPIGAILVINNRVVGRGHNQRIQQNSVVLHGEMDCLENTGRLSPAQYRQATMYTTLSPCDMCSGAILLYKIPRVVVGENKTFMGAEDYLRSKGIKVDVLQNEECVKMMTDFIKNKPRLWNEDIGEV